MGCVYAWRNIITGKYYVGKTIHTVWWRHRCTQRNAMRGDKPNSHFYNSIRKHGWEAFEPIILHESNDERELFRWERACVCLFDSHYDGYNLTDGGEGVSGAHFSMNPITIAHRIAARKGKPLSDTNRAAIKAAWDRRRAEGTATWSKEAKARAKETRRQSGQQKRKPRTDIDGLYGRRTVTHSAYFNSPEGLARRCEAARLREEKKRQFRRDIVKGDTK